MSEYLVKCLLIFFRIIGVISLTPVLGDRAFPVPAKIGLGLFLTILLYPSVQINLPNLTLSTIISAVFKELLVGITIGLAVLIICVFIQTSGEIMGFQMGMWMATMIDPHFGIETPIISHIGYLLTLLLFLCTNGHLLVLKGLRDSFALIPLGGFVLTSNLSSEILHLGGTLFRLGFQIGAPIIFGLLLFSLSTAIIARIIPEMNVLFVLIPAQISLGLILLGLSLPYIVGVLSNILSGLYPQILKIIRFAMP